MAVTNSLTANRQAAGKQSLVEYLQIDAVKRQIINVLGEKRAMRFATSIVSAYQATPALRECTNSSIVNAALLGEALDLSPAPQMGHYHLVPFNNRAKGCKEVQFVLGYKGLLQLAVRSGCYKKLNVLPIKQGELVRFDPLEEEIEVSIIPDEEVREKSPTIGYYAMFLYENGFRKAMYWSKEKMLSHADRYSAAFSKASYEKIQKGEIPEKDLWKYSSFWYKDFDSMAVKTMLKQLISKWGIMSIDIQRAFVSDGAPISVDGNPEYVDLGPMNEEDIIDEATPNEEKGDDMSDLDKAFVG